MYLVKVKFTATQQHYRHDADGERYDNGTTIERFEYLFVAPDNYQERWLKRARLEVEWRGDNDPAFKIDSIEFGDQIHGILTPTKTMLGSAT